MANTGGGGYTWRMAADEPDAPLVRLTPSRSNDRAARAGVLAVLLWGHPAGKALIFAVGGLGLFGGGIWAGRVLERSGKPEALSASAGPQLTAPVSTMAIQKPSSGSPAPTQANPSSLTRFSGQWVGGEAPPTADANFYRPEAVGGQAPAEAVGGPQALLRGPKETLAPKTFEAGARSATGGAPAAGAAASKGAGGAATPAGAGAHRATSLGKVPGVGTAVEIQVTAEMAKGGADRTGQFGAAAASGGPRLMTTEAGVAPIGIDAARAFGIFEGKGPHAEGGTGPEPGGGIGGADVGAGGPTKINLGGKQKEGGADR